MSEIRRRATKGILLLTVTALLGGGASLTAFTAQLPGTWIDRVAGKKSPDRSAPTRAEPDRVAAEGRLVTYPGAEVVVGTEVKGRIVRLAVSEKSPVRAGDVLAELGSDDLRASLAEAEAKVAEADADITYFEREQQRRRQLMGRGSASTWELDADTRALLTARARREAARAQGDRFRAEIAKTRIVAPIDGVVVSRDVQPGETVDAGAPLVTIVDLSRLRIEAEVDEYDAPRIVLGAPVVVTAEGYPDGMSWTGHVEEVPDRVVGRRIRPEDPGRPIDTRVLLVKVAVPAGTPLKLGQRVEVAITVPATPAREDSAAPDRADAEGPGAAASPGRLP